MKSRLLAGVGFGMLLLFTSTARADEDRKQEASAQGMGFFTTDSTGNGRTQKSTDTGGFLLSYRYHFNRWLGADVSYGRVRDTERTLTTSIPLPLPPIFGPGPRVLPITLPVQSNIHEATAAAVVTVPTSGRFRPYVLAGTGAFAFLPPPKTFCVLPGAGNRSQQAFGDRGGADSGRPTPFPFPPQHRGFFYNR